MMGSHQMSERQVIEAIQADAIKTVFEEYVDRHGLAEIVDVFGKGRQDRGRRTAAVEAVRTNGCGACPRAWRRRSRSTPARMSGAGLVHGFVLAGCTPSDQISRSAEARADHVRDK